MNDFDFTAQTLAAMPEHVRRQLRDGLLRFLREIGVTPMVDADTGEVVVDLAAISDALGLTPEEAIVMLQTSGPDKQVREVARDRLAPLN